MMRTVQQTRKQMEPPARRPVRQRSTRSQGMVQLERSARRLEKLLRSDPQLAFLRADRDLLMAGMERMMAGREPEETRIDLTELAHGIAGSVLTREFRQETREILEDSLRFRRWRPADRKALTAAAMLASLDEQVGGLDGNPLWMTLLSVSIEDFAQIEDAVMPLLHQPEMDGPENGEDAEFDGAEEVAAALEISEASQHYLFQPLFRAAHRTARMLTDDQLGVVIPLYEVLPMFLAVFQVWAEKSNYGEQPAETLPSLHHDVLEAFQSQASRTLDEDVRAAIAQAIEREAVLAGERGEEALKEQLEEAGQFSSAFSWEQNPIASQLLLKLCSSPELCCIGPGAAEALRLAGDPTVAEHFHAYGSALLRQGEFRGAGRVFAAGLEFLGHQWQGLLDLALVYRALGEEDLARRVFAEALAAPDITLKGRSAIECEIANVSRGLELSRPF